MIEQQKNRHPNEKESILEEYTVHLPIPGNLEVDEIGYLEKVLNQVFPSICDYHYVVTPEGEILLVNRYSTNASVGPIYIDSYDRVYADLERFIRTIFEGSQSPQLPEFSPYTTERITEEQITQRMRSTRKGLSGLLKSLFSDAHSRKVDARSQLYRENMEVKKAHEQPQLKQIEKALEPHRDVLLRNIVDKTIAAKEKQMRDNEVVSVNEITFDPKSKKLDYPFRVNEYDVYLLETYSESGDLDGLNIAAHTEDDGELFKVEFPLKGKSISLPEPLDGITIKCASGICRLFCTSPQFTIKIKRGDYDRITKTAE